MWGLEALTDRDVSISVVVAGTLVSGMASGLNLAYFSLDMTAICSLAMGTNEVLAKRAKRVLYVLQHPYWLLVTTLLFDVVASEVLAVTLEDLVGPIVAIPVSVAILLIFGEIIPQALFINNALTVCSSFAYIMYALMVITAPLTLVVSFVLDTTVGHREAVFYRRRELREFIMFHQAQPATSTQQGPLLPGAAVDYASDIDEDGFVDVGGVLEREEIKLMMGALALSEANVKSIMRTPLRDAFCIDINARITKELVETVLLRGKSRIPVYTGSPTNCTHYLIAKTLIVLAYKKVEHAPYVRDLTLVPAQFIYDDDLLGEAYQTLTSQPVHMLFVREAGTQKTIGLVTTMDVLETIHNAKFVDEYDLSNNRKPMQLLLKSCWTDTCTRRSSIRKSRGPGRGSLLPGLYDSRRSELPRSRPHNSTLPPTLRSQPPSHRPLVPSGHLAGDSSRTATTFGGASSVVNINSELPAHDDASIIASSKQLPASSRSDTTSATGHRHRATRVAVKSDERLLDVAFVDLHSYGSTTPTHPPHEDMNEAK